MLGILVLLSASCPNPGRDQRQEANQIVLAWPRFVKGVNPLSSPPSLGCLTVCTVQHNVGFGWPRRVEALDFKRRLWPEAARRRALSMLAHIHFLLPRAAAPPGSIVLVAVVVLLQ